MVEVTRTVSFSPQAVLTYFTTDTCTLETRRYLQTCHPVECIRNLLQALNKSSSFQKTWDSKGEEPTEASVKTFCRGRKRQPPRPWTYLYWLWHRLALSIFPFPVYRGCAKHLPPLQSAQRKIGHTAGESGTEFLCVHGIPNRNKLSLIQILKAFSALDVCMGFAKRQPHSF